MKSVQLLNRLKSWRRDLHAIPEMSNSEFKTSAYLEQTIAPTQCLKIK